MNKAFKRYPKFRYTETSYFWHHINQRIQRMTDEYKVMTRQLNKRLRSDDTFAIRKKAP